MIVFKLYWKIFSKNFVTVLIYFIVFIFITLIAINSYKPENFEYSNVKSGVVFVDEDDTELTRGLKNYLENYATFKDISKDKIDDALFYNDISMYIEIPKGYTASLTGEEILKIKTRSHPSSPNTQIIFRVIHKYSQLAFVYLNNDLGEDDLIFQLREKLDLEVETLTLVDENENFYHPHFYYNYMAYIIIALVLTVISSIMISFKPLGVKRRNMIASISDRKFNTMLFLGNFILGLAFIIGLIAISIILFPEAILTKNGLFLMLNALIFTIPMIALAYLIVTIFDSRNVIGAFGTIFSLGFSFITGVFIPQYLLDKNILLIARLIPSYYYIQNNERIASLKHFNFDNLESIFGNFLIQFAFTLVFFIITIYVSRRRRTQEN
jgi:ABC-2 type transport system permease protein